MPPTRDAPDPEGPVRVERDDGVAIVRLQRPDRANAFDVPTIEALREAVGAELEHPGVRCLVLAGAEGVFCAGGDVHAMADALERGEGLPSHFKRLTRHHHPLVRSLRQTSTPVVTAVDGVAAGGGLGLALAGDVRVASERARFEAAYPRLHVVPDGGVTHLLPRIAGLAVAQRMLLMDEALDADAARAHGLVHRVVPPEDILGEALEMAGALAARDGFAVERTKRLLERAPHHGLGNQLEQERRWNAEGAGREAVADAVRAFARRGDDD